MPSSKCWWLEWPPCPPSGGSIEKESSDPDREYIHIWNSYERALSENLQLKGECLAKSQRGRACVLDIRVVKHHYTPVRAARNGEVQPFFFGISLQQPIA